MDTRTDAKSKDTSDTLRSDFKAGAGVEVTYWQLRSGGQVQRQDAVILRAHKADGEPCDLRFKLKGEERIAYGIRRGASNAEAPCWMPR